MPVETLRPSDGLKGAPFCPSDGLTGVPFCPSDGLKGAPFCPSEGRLFRLKAPEYLRRQSAPSRRLSAVERLEADKVKYVKSQQVALTRQAPVIRKALLPPALACPAPGRIQTPPARTAPRSAHSSAHSTARSSGVRSSAARSTGRVSVLDLDVLNDLISDVCNGSQSDGSSVENQPSGGQRESGDGQREAGRESDFRTDSRLTLRSCYKTSAHSSSPRRSLRSTENEPKHPAFRPLTRPLTRPPPVPLRPAHAAAVRRVDVRPSEVRTPQRRPLQLAPPSAPPTLPSPPALPPRSPLLCRANMLPPASPAFTRLSNASSRGSRGSARKRPALHRSQSDLSERLSRAAADLERFFNFCGLDPDEVQALGTERFSPRANSDIVSGRRSVSSTSEGEELTERAELAEDREEQVSERTPYGISVIERNARVIKWLYGLRQATGGGARGGGATGGATSTNV